MRMCAGRGVWGVLVLAVLTGGLQVSAQTPVPPSAPSFPCGGTNPKGVVLWPVTKFSNGEFTNAGADCAMWQNFIYLNWPAASGKRGVPDLTATFGAPGTTVWETFLTADQVFLPQGAKPQAWDTTSLRTGLPAEVATRIATGEVRLLNARTKVSAQVARAAKRNAGVEGIPLQEIEQAFNSGVLYDQQSLPVYYEIAMNKTQYDYITQNGLYNADTQAAYAQKTNIVLPSGSMEIKAAWKVLTAAEAASGRFHTSQGYIVNSGTGETVPIGLVGLHVFASEGAENAGLWATFYQVDNAPLQAKIGSGPYSFYNPSSSTAPNTAGTNPTQVVQVFPDDSSSVTETKQAQAMFKTANAQSPWQYYAMIATQWSQAVINLDAPIPATLPLSAGKPDQILPSSTLMNPVLETFMQTKGTNCMSCHSYAATPQGGVATGFSYMFSRAQSPK